MATNRSVGNLYGTMVFEGSMTLDEMRHQLQNEQTKYECWR